MERTFTAVFQPADEGGYIAWVEELPGAWVHDNLKEAIQLILGSI